MPDRTGVFYPPRPYQLRGQRIHHSPQTIDNPHTGLSVCMMYYEKFKEALVSRYTSATVLLFLQFEQPHEAGLARKLHLCQFAGTVCLLEDQELNINIITLPRIEYKDPRLEYDFFRQRRTTTSGTELARDCPNVMTAVEVCHRNHSHVFKLCK